MRSSASVRAAQLAFAASLLAAPAAFAQTKNFPPTIADSVTDPAYGAKGDGKTDDTSAIQAALIGDRTPQSQPDYYAPRPRLVYFPPGTYLVSDTITWLGDALQLQGSGTATIIQLRDNAAGFNDATHRKPIFQTTDGNYSFKQHVWDMVIDTGHGNSGAVGIDWIANNVGALRGLTVRSGDGGGVAGIDLTRAWPGPALIRDVTVQGFDYGIDVAQPEYGMTFENITIEHPKVAAIRNQDNVLSVRHLTTHDAPLAVDNQTSNSMLILLDSALAGTGTAAIQNQGDVYLRNVSATGFGAVLSELGFRSRGLRPV